MRGGRRRCGTSVAQIKLFWAAGPAHFGGMIVANSLMNVAVNSALKNSGSCNRLRSANVGDVERFASVIGGTCLALFGLTRRGATSKVVLPVLGSLLAYRGLSGYCAAYDVLG